MYWKAHDGSGYIHEQEAINYLRRNLGFDPLHAGWSNFTFVDSQGFFNEIDAMVFTRAGLFLIEIKSYVGKLVANQSKWSFYMQGRKKPRVVENPLIALDRKAKQLKNFLCKTEALNQFRGSLKITPLIFLNNISEPPACTPELEPMILRCDGPTPETVPEHRGILWALEHGPAMVSAAVRRPEQPEALLDRIKRAFDKKLPQPRKRRNLAGYILEDVVAEGAYYRDWRGTNRETKTSRLLRIYNTRLKEDAAKKARIAKARLRECRILETLKEIRAMDVRPLPLEDAVHGDALILDISPEAWRLDHYIQQTRLNQHQQRALVIQLSQAMAAAHDHQVFHRLLSPASIWVEPKGSGGARLKIINWAHGKMADTETSLSNHISTASDFIATSETAYLAPTSPNVAETNPMACDVFSLGAIAYLVFSGRPPASHGEALIQALRHDQGLSLLRVVEGFPDAVARVIAKATHPQAKYRYLSVADFMEALTTAFHQVDERLAPRSFSPLDLRAEDLGLSEETQITRLGQGATAVVYRVPKDGKMHALKLALEPGNNDVLVSELAALNGCDSPRILKPTQKTVMRLHNHVALWLQPAEQSLAAYFRSSGQLSLDMQARLGKDLIEALHHLEQKGVLHRDIKPENLGIVTDAKSGQKRLVLMDFSLHNQPLDSLKIGTRAYRDPFLPLRKRWDSDADRYAAAVTLCQMVTGKQVAYGEDDPSLSGLPGRIDEDALIPAVKPGLSAFFEKAFAPDNRRRFDTAVDMYSAWEQAFEVLTESSKTPHGERVLQLDAHHLDSRLAALELPPGLLSLFEQEGLFTVRDVMEQPGTSLQAIPGVTAEMRRQLKRVRHEFVHYFKGSQLASASEELLDFADFYQKLYTKNEGDNRLLRAVLEPGRLAKDGPALLRHAAKQCDVDWHQVKQAVRRACNRWWERKRTDFRRLAKTLQHILQREGGLLSLETLVDRFARRCFAPDQVVEMRNTARGLVRAALLMVASRVHKKDVDYIHMWQTRPMGLDLALGLDSDGGLQQRFNLLFDHMEQFDLWVQEETLVGQAQVNVLLAEQPLAVVDGLITLLTPDRAAELVVQFTRDAKLSGRGDLYLRNLAPQNAVNYGRSALLRLHRLSVQEVHGRLQQRFPEAARLPDRPALDKLLEAADLNLAWDDQEAVYVAMGLPGTSQASSQADQRTAQERLSDEEREVQIAEFEARLQHSLDHGGLLFLRTFRFAYRQVADRLAKTWSTQVVDGNAWVIEAMQAMASRYQVPWSAVLEADGEGSGNNWHNLMRLVRFCRPSWQQAPGAGPGPTLLVHPGLLARYHNGDNQLLSLFHDWREQLRTRTLWVLLANAGMQTDVSLDGENLGVITNNEYWWVPPGWATAKENAP